ncbi:UDP-glucosyltransferase 2-like [Zophobas morio]
MNLSVKSIFLLVFGTTLISSSHSAKILCVFPVPSPSVLTVYQVISKELSLRGHQVTVITSKPLNDHSLSNLTEIEISTLNDIERRNRPQMEMIFKNEFFLNRLFYYEQYFINFAEEVLDHVDSLFPDPSTNFDLLILENFHQLIYSLGCRFKAPIIGINSDFIPVFVYDQLGIPSVDFSTTIDNNVSFFNNVINFIGTLVKVPHSLYTLYTLDKKSKRYFGKDCPNIEDIVYNVSLVLMNTNPVINSQHLSVPKLVPILLDLKPNQGLSNDVRRYLDESTRGIVYFNLGTNLHSTIIETIMASISQLPYDVLWLLDHGAVPYTPENLLIKKTLVQHHVLRHPKTKVFVSQGDLISVQEAVASSVPLVGMPFAFDQFGNVKKIADLGIAQSIDYATMTKDDLKEIIIEVAENNKYKESITHVNKLIQDKPSGGLEKSIWWIEYVIRHKGTKYLRSETATMSWMQYFLIWLDSSFENVLGCLYNTYEYMHF